MPALSNNSKWHNMNKKYAFVLALLSASHPGYAVLHPQILNPTIRSCETGRYRCSAAVRYQSTGTGTIDVVPRGIPNPNGSRELQTIGVHCMLGDASSGIAFSDCEFDDTLTHRPNYNGCRLASTEAWDLDPSSQCQTDLTWGGHTGAGPGGECVLFVQKGEWSSASALTIYGRVNPTEVANAGNLFCQKPLPPNVGCSISLSAEIDHRTIAPTARSDVSITGTVDCGASPKVTVMGGGELSLAPGLKSNVIAQLDGTGGVSVTSRLEANDAPAGEHRGAVIVVISPF